MKQIQFSRPGPPAEVAQCVEVADPMISALDDVLVRVEVFPINPADLLTMQGFYPRSDPGSPTLGIEALGVVEAIGAAVVDITPGDCVVLLTSSNWSQKKLVKPRELVRVSPNIDRFQLATLKVNPATATLLLTLFVDLQPEDWILQNAANSAVGRAVIQIANNRGIRTVNVVRREDVIPDLKGIGADVVLVDGDDLPRRVAQATNNASIGLAVDAVAGTATNRLASCLAATGTLVVYGAMSGEAAHIDPSLLVFQNINVRGFWLTRHLASAPRPETLQLYAELERLVDRGQLKSRVDSVFPVEGIKFAVKQASEIGGTGKVFVTFD